MGIHLIKDNKVIKYKQASVEKEVEIEEFLEKHPKILDDDIFIIGRQVQTSSKARIDLMGLDKNGNVVIIEIKKGVSARDVVSQILEYGVWAENIQYEDLNSIAKEKHLDSFPDLYKKYETEFKSIPEPFNQNQRLYIVSEKIDQKIEEICRYLKVRGIDIKCVELNFYENEGQKLAETKIKVGTEETIYQELGEDSKTEQLGWSDKLEIASPENKKTVLDLIEKIQKKFTCQGEPHGRFYYIYTKKETKKGGLFAVINCGKETARIAFRINPETFDMADDRIREVKGWFFSNSERRVSISRDSIDFILNCLSHSFDTTEEYMNDEKERQSEAARKAWRTRRATINQN